MSRAKDVEIDPADAMLPPRRDMHRLRFQLSLIVIDALMLCAATALANKLWPGGLGASAGSGVAMAITFVPFYLLAGGNGRAFAADILGDRLKSALRAIRSVGFACVSVIFAAFFLKAGAELSRMALLISGLLGMVMVGGTRLVFHQWISRSAGGKLYSEVLVVDDCEMQVPDGVFLLDTAALNLRCDLNDPLMLDRIGRLLAPADRVIVACGLEKRRTWAMLLKGINIQAEVISPEISAIGPIGTGHFEGCSTIVVATGSLHRYERFLKRGLDLALASITILLLAPFLMIVAIAIKIDDRGPIFFVQDRVGRGNQLFGIYKFRSMRVDMCDRSGKRSTARDDDRVTRVGRLIRATSIDEMPQLLNILKGDMSFVGPRPHALGSLAGDMLFWEVDERYWHRHVCKPGITGLAQVRGFRGATDHQSDLVNRLQADLEYVSGWTIWRDLAILLATLRVVVHRNAY
jgi:lipopolysaccharide/colanic/teichoic acid biosynthesis glycosyltransferase